MKRRLRELMMWFSRETWRKKRRRVIYYSNPKDSEWSTSHWNWALHFILLLLLTIVCGYYCSHWIFPSIHRTSNIWNILFVLMRDMLTGTNVSWPNISLVPPDSSSKIVLTKQMDYRTPREKSGEFVNLMSCRLQNHKQVVRHCSTEHLF